MRDAPTHDQLASRQREVQQADPVLALEAHFLGLPGEILHFGECQRQQQSFDRLKSGGAPILD